RSENIRGAIDDRRDSIIGQRALDLRGLEIIRYQDGDMEGSDFLGANLGIVCQKIRDLSCNSTGLPPTILQGCNPNAQWLVASFVNREGFRVAGARCVHGNKINSGNDKRGFAQSKNRTHSLY